MFVSRIVSAPNIRRDRKVFAPLLAASFVGLLAGAGSEGEGKAEKPPEAIALFDGKSLDGWKKTDFFKAGAVQVDDGAILIAPGKPMSGVTITRTDLPKVDFELTYEAQRLTGSDFFAAATFPVQDAFIAFVNGGWGGSVTGLSCLNGADASENDTSLYIKYQNKTWYRFRVRVTADTIRCWIDDRQVVAVNYKHRPVSTRLETRSNQPLGFATWEASSAIRKITVRKLTPAEVAETTKKEDD